MLEPTESGGSCVSQRAVLREVIAEFGRHLDVLADQLATSVAEADREFVAVGASFHELSAAKAAVAAVPCPEPGATVLQDSCRQIADSIQTAVVALQYHDRLAQRLAIVRAGLVRLQSLLQEPSPRSYDTWLRALRDVEAINRHEQRRLGPVAGDTPDAGSDHLPNSSVELF